MGYRDNNIAMRSDIDFVLYLIDTEIFIDTLFYHTSSYLDKFYLKGSPIE